MMRAASWERVKAWQDRLARAVPAGCKADCQRFFEVDRLRLEVLADRGTLLEVRIPCKHGELYPVGSGRWGWSGRGGDRARKVLAALGDDAAGPLGLAAEAGTKHDEAVIWFPARRVLDVAELVGARRRRHSGNVAHFAGAAWTLLLETRGTARLGSGPFFISLPSRWQGRLPACA